MPRQCFSRQATPTAKCVWESSNALGGFGPWSRRRRSFLSEPTGLDTVCVAADDPVIFIKR
jgi:hypothetical protein